MVNNETETWTDIDNKEKFIKNFFLNPPAYGAIFFKREILYKHGYFNLLFSQRDYEKLNFEPDEIMTVHILSIFHGKAIVSGKVVNVRGIGEANYSRSEFWLKTRRISVAMPLLKLYFYFKNKNKFLSNYFLKLAVFRYCFFPLNIPSLFYFKKLSIFFIMIFSRLFFEIRFFRVVNFLTRKLFNLNEILKK